MEQYEIAKDKLFDDLKYCLENSPVARIYIRGVGSRGGGVEVDEQLEDKVLDIEQVDEGISILIDGKQVFLYEQDEEWGKDFAVAYERVGDDGVMIFLPRGYNPNDPNLPEPRKSKFHGANNDFYMEIYFKGRIPLEFNSGELGSEYWCIDRSKS